MRSYIVFSDIHGDRFSLMKIKSLISLNDGAFFAGDGLSMVKKITDREFYAVCGNCDFSGPPETVTEIDGVRILLTHGHKYGVKSSLLSLTLRAKELNCSVAIFGHTHDPLCAYENGILLLNPGACSGYGKKTYARLCIEDGKANATINII